MSGISDQLVAPEPLFCVTVTPANAHCADKTSVRPDIRLSLTRSGPVMFSRTWILVPCGIKFESRTIASEYINSTSLKSQMVIEDRQHAFDAARGCLQRRLRKERAVPPLAGIVNRLAESVLERQVAVRPQHAGG